MDNIERFFSNSETLNLIFLILAILGIVLAVYFYTKAKREKKPEYNISTIQLIKDNLSAIEKLKILYDGNPVANISLTRISFWNAGRETIRESDFVKNDLLRIETKESIIIYDYKIENQDKRNNFQIHPVNKNCLHIHFDYLDLNHGLILTVYHSGKESSDIKLTGSFMGSLQIEEGTEREKLTNLFFNLRLIRWHENLMNNEKPLQRRIGIFLLLPMLFIVITLGLPILLLDKLYDKLFNKSPKEFYLNKI